MKLPWSTDRARDDPCWEAFINRAPADRNNLIPHAFKQAQGGGVNPVKTEVHSPNVMSNHIKELARFYGADEVGIVGLRGGDGFGIVCLLQADYDTRTALGIGGQTPSMKGVFATFTLGAFIRELGYRAACVDRPDKEGLAALAGMGSLNADGRLVTRRFGSGVHVAEVIETDLPLEPDGRETGA